MSTFEKRLSNALKEISQPEPLSGPPSVAAPPLSSTQSFRSRFSGWNVFAAGVTALVIFATIVGVAVLLSRTGPASRVAAVGSPSAVCNASMLTSSAQLVGVAQTGTVQVILATNQSCWLTQPPTVKVGSQVAEYVPTFSAAKIPLALAPGRLLQLTLASPGSACLNYNAGAPVAVSVTFSGRVVSATNFRLASTCASGQRFVLTSNAYG